MSAEIDQAEIDAYEKALAAFDEAYVNVVQATRRLILIKRGNPRKPPTVKMATGSSCERCQSMKVIYKNGGCKVCLDCHFEMGCGG